MEVNCSHISYQETGYFSKIVTDYLNQAPQLQPFYQHEVSLKGIKQSIEARKKFNTNRTVLVEQLTKQYEGLPLTHKQQQNLQSLLSEHTFTITTAHQPNIFTGPLYFIYKIMHAIKLADDLKVLMPEYNFVPFYYMGSEDADLDELGYINLGGEKLVWQTNQTGAVGRMKVDKNLLQLIDCIYGQIGIHLHGNELINIFKLAYTEDKTIQQATLELLNTLFQQFGLLVVIPDNATLKAEFNEVINKEIAEKFSHQIVQNTIDALNKNYKVQAAGRAINLFYLYENNRERIEQEGNLFTIKKLNKKFQLIELQEEIKKYPERFSANVILRGIFQETILPNIAFIGGGGELAYWLELKNVFEAVHVPYPLLVLRNSFLIIKDKINLLINSLNLSSTDLFKTKFELIESIVLQTSGNQLNLDEEIDQIKRLYQHIQHLSALVDETLKQHAQALETTAVHKLTQLEKKIRRAEKRKFTEVQTQITKIKAELFPQNNLQERVENFSLYYAREGNGWLQKIYDCSNGLDQKFTIII
jgi:bacillithiol biosynthesis cysteine-adding enzyme BshC